MFPRAIARQIDGSFALIDLLRAQGHPIHAITNFSAETWPEALRLHPRLGQVFDVTLVSGQMRIIKPDRRIFEALTDRTGARPGDCLFIDDSAPNIAGARAAGWRTHLFDGPARLERALVAEGLL
nr:HAD-IA family hydrolase [Rhodobacter sp. NTK016B]